MYIQGPIKHLKKDDFSRQFANLGFIKIYVSINQEPSVHRFSKQVCHNLCQLCFRETIINLPHRTVSSDHSQIQILEQSELHLRRVYIRVCNLPHPWCMFHFQQSLPRNVPILLQIYPLLSYSVENYLFSVSLATRNGIQCLLNQPGWTLVD